MSWHKLSLQLGIFIFVFALLAVTALAERPGVMVEAEIAHDSMDMRIGYPAMIEPGQPYPVLSVENRGGDELELRGGILRLDDGTTVQSVAPQRLAAGMTTRLAFEGAPEPGRYRWQFSLLDSGQTVFMDSYYFSVFDTQELPENYSRVVHPGEDGRLVYIPDYRGNRIPDFSRVGYKSGEKEIPEVPVRVTLEPEEGDNAARIQAAIDEVSALGPDENGIRGAVLLKAGVYEVRRSLNIRAGGVVLRGEGPGEDTETLWLEPEMLDPEHGLSRGEFAEMIAGRGATVLIYPARGTHGVLIARGGGIQVEEERAARIVDNYVPVGSFSFTVDDPSELTVGDQIIVRRRGNAEWISEIKMDQIPGERPWGARNWDFERAIAAIDGNLVTVDSPIVNAIEKRWGGGEVYRYSDSNRIRNVGMENMRVVMYDRLRGGLLSHMRGIAAVFRDVRDGWIRGVVAEHCGDRVFTIRDSSHITVRDSSVLIAPRRYFEGYVPHYGFFFGANANHILVRDCYALHNRHAYVICAWVRGPNVVYNSVGDGSSTWSEPHHRWSTGGLFDNVEEYRIAFMNRLHYGSGHGWAGANYVAWNTRGGLVCQQPPTAQNWAIGHEGERVRAPFHRWNVEQFGYSYGYWESRGRHVEPRSLYMRQLQDRLGSAVLRRMGY